MRSNLGRKTALRKIFHAAGLRLTRQRLAILRELANRSDHPDVNTLYRALKARMPRLSLFTVYRTMNALEAIGLVRRAADWNGTVRYDARLEPHAHFLCRKCGKIFNLDWSDHFRLGQGLAQNLGRVHQVDLLIHGEETDCQGTADLENLQEAAACGSLA